MLDETTKLFQIGWQIVKRILDKLTILIADQGYDWWLLRQILRAEGVNPVIKHREFGWHGIANNLLHDDTIYHQRPNAESIYFPLRRKYDKIFRARMWFVQFRLEAMTNFDTQGVEVITEF